MTIKTRVSIINPKALNGILELTLARAIKQPEQAGKLAMYAQELAESIGAIVIIEGGN